MKRSLRIQVAITAELLLFHTAVWNFFFITYPKYGTCSTDGIYCIVYDRNVAWRRGSQVTHSWYMIVMLHGEEARDK
jgi:hypothetical protein